MHRLTALTLCALLLPACYAADAIHDLPEELVEGEYVLGMSEEATETSLTEWAMEEGLELVEARGFDRLAVVVDPQLRSSTELLDLLAESELTDFAEPQYIYETVRVPNDYGEYLWGLENSGVGGGRAGADIGAFEAWDLSTGAGTVIAVIDTGIDSEHPDLAPRLWRNEGEIPGNGIDDDGNGYVDDIHGYDFVHRDGNPDDEVGHGTHVAGTAAARGDDGFGVVGTAFDAEIMALKFLSAGGGGHSSMAAEAINYAVNNGADVINASWGSFGYSTAIRNAVAYGRSRGVLFIAAAGNQGNNNDAYPFYPASYELDSLVAVGASDRADRLAGFSNYGASGVHIAAPGSEIVSTWLDSNWVYQDGTSMAAPFVAGSVALLKSASPGASHGAIRSALLSSTSELASGGERVATGRLNAHGALLELLGDPEEEVPLDEEDVEPPADDEWTFVSMPIASAHPYPNNFSGSADIVAPDGASELRLHFDRIDVESSYDFVVVKSWDGTKMAEWTGNLGSVTSDVLREPRVRVHLYTDASVTAWGLELSGFSWR